MARDPDGEAKQISPQRFNAGTTQGLKTMFTAQSFDRFNYSDSRIARLASLAYAAATTPAALALYAEAGAAAKDAAKVLAHAIAYVVTVACWGLSLAWQSSKRWGVQPIKLVESAADALAIAQVLLELLVSRLYGGWAQALAKVKAWGIVAG
jgi:hypothetical protein